LFSSTHGEERRKRQRRTQDKVSSVVLSFWAVVLGGNSGNGGEGPSDHGFRGDAHTIELRLTIQNSSKIGMKLRR
jgi:hypothetical protein